MKLALAILYSATLASGPTLAQQSAVPTQPDYDTFCKIDDPAEKRQAFLGTTAENRGKLIRTHLERWRDANKARLNEKQLAHLSAMIDSITAETYADGPAGEKAREKSRALEAQSRELFSMPDLQAMQPTGRCLPKVG